MSLIKCHEQTKTFSAYYAGYGFHGTNKESVVRELNSLICRMPGCTNTRREVNKQDNYLCSDHLTDTHT